MKKFNHVRYFSVMTRTFDQVRLDSHSKSFASKVEKEISRFNGVVTRNRGRSLVGWIVNNLVGVSGGVSASKVRLVALFSFMCFRIVAAEGRKGLVQTLKTSHVLIQQAVGGDVVGDLTSLKKRVRRSRSGLPKWIPVQQRQALLAGNIGTVRFWTTLVALYRVIDFPGALNLDTITAEGLDIRLSARLQRALNSVIGYFWDHWGPIDKLRNL